MQQRPTINLDAVGRVAVHGRHVPRRIVLHDTEGHDAKGVQDLSGVINFWHHQALGYGAHVIVDGDGHSARCALPTQICWHVANHNTGSVGIEQIGFAAFTREDWLKRARQLDAVATWIAWWGHEYGIPLVHSTDHGVCTHADFHGSHTDPGSGYPFAHVLDLARRKAATSVPRRGAEARLALSL